MAPTSYAIDPEWGESLVGLRMAVPLSWWPGYTGTELSLGKIAKFDGAASPPFLLEVDDEPGDTYAMQYDALLAYAQVEHLTFKNFRLLDMMPEEPTPNDTVIIRRHARGQCQRGRKRRRVRVRPSSPMPTLTSRADSASDDSSNDDNDSDNNNDGVGRLLRDDETMQTQTTTQTTRRWLLGARTPKIGRGSRKKILVLDGVSTPSPTHLSREMVNSST